jgi:multiple sugar transport system substrate-binding protein
MSTTYRSPLTRRRLLTAGALATLTTIVAACGGPPPAPTAAPTPAAKPTEASKPAAPAAPAPGQIALRLHARAGVEDEMFNKILPKFEAANPGVTFTQEVFPGGEYLQKLQTLAAGGTLGDVLQLFTSDASYMLFFVGGSLAAVDNYLKADNVDLAQWYKYSMDACRVDGKIGGLPFKSHPSRVGLFYNATIFEKAGMKVPDLDWTYDQLVETAQKLNKPPDVFAFSTRGVTPVLSDHGPDVRRRLLH